MILLLEADRTFSKRLCDLLDRERVVVSDSERQALEMVVKYKGDINALVANHRQFTVTLAHQVLAKVCQKLGIEPIPAIGYHKKGDPEPPAELRSVPGYRLIDCDEADPGFPEVFLRALREAYPDLNVELDKARIMWAAKTEDLLDINKWLDEAGFGEMDRTALSAAPVVPKIKPKPKQTEPPRKTPEPPKKAPAPPPKPVQGPPDYKKMYEDLKREHDALKRKHDELLKQVKDIIDL